MQIPHALARIADVWVGRGARQVTEHFAVFIKSAGGTRVEEFEAVEGGCRIYHARFGGWREFAPWPRPLATTLQVDAGRYQLLVRIVQLDLPADSKPEP